MKSHGSWLFTTALGIVIASTIAARSGLPAVNGPVIQLSPLNPMNEYKEVILQKGQNFTITCQGDRPLDIKQQLIREEIVGDFSMQLTDTETSNYEKYPFEKTLTLYNVDRYAVGYYVCFDETVDSDKILNILEEPTDTEHATYIYVYVNSDGPDQELFAPMSEIAIHKNSSHVIIQCRPTMPDVNMTITDVAESLNDNEIYSYNPKTGMTVNVTELPSITDETPEIKKVWVPKIGFLVRRYNNSPQSSFECKGTRGSITLLRSARIRLDNPEACNDITIVRDSEFFMNGDTFILNCSIPYRQNAAVDLYWSVPRNLEEQNATVSLINQTSVGSGQNVYQVVMISNATREDAGSYSCNCKKGYGKIYTKSETKTFLEAPFIVLHTDKTDLKIRKEINYMTLKFTVDAYPKPAYTFFLNNQRLPVQETSVKKCTNPGAAKYRLEVSTITNSVLLVICNFTLEDSGDYTMVANNNYLKENLTISLKKEAPPTIELSPVGTIIHHQPNQKRSIRCVVKGYPLATIQWVYTTDDGLIEKIKGDNTQLSIYKIQSTVSINPQQSGNLTCKATVDSISRQATKRVLVYEILRGFGIVDTPTWYPEGEKVAIRCLASIYDFENVTWRGPRGEELVNVQYNVTKLSHVATLVFDWVSLSDAGTYICVGRKFNDSEEHESKTIDVEALRAPFIIDPETDRDEIVEKFQNVEFSCIVDAVPPPKIVWYKDGDELQNNTDGINILYHQNQTVVNSTIMIQQVKNENEGQYQCQATSARNSNTKVINLKVSVPQAFTHIPAVTGGVLSVLLLLIALVIYLMWRVRKERQFRNELAAAGLLYFKEGVTKSLNPELGIDEQAELLPYDMKFEFPAEKLQLGKQLGAGAFGVVYRAEARGIIDAEESTTVAVKMVKKTADNMYIKALASELKIMVHLGKHVNIVNLLGACTQNVGKRELIVIVEYCKFGNIHNYMQKHREVFIDQLTDNKEKNLGRVNRGYSCSSASSGMNSDYFGTHSQATDHTLLNSTNTHRSERKVSEAGYVQPEWRSNYESDYSFDGRNPRPLSSRDLLAWAFQIARGMEYLASRKILHGDLAARNVLLAEDNVVKICDFGLAKSIYKNDEYQKKENSPLPVKWLAIECMTDRIFTTQSDVWAFGIVLWEMFSLAKTPYPNMNPQHLLQWLSSGHRLEKPAYADDRLYDVMMRCWEHKPNARPSFTKLQETLGSFLEENVRNHYVDLNSVFNDLNVKNAGEEDYLAMVSAPDYNNMVTPSPHQYVNDARSFFPPSPTQVPLDEEGYLQMTPVNPSIFSPRSHSTKFDFDMKQLDGRVAETRAGSESTPMLTLNNLSTRSGSDSDHESHSPYLKMCPRIVEESDDVFKVNENNEKNIQNSAVTNPTYISLDLEIDKKPQDINSYINIPNGLVK